MTIDHRPLAVLPLLVLFSASLLASCTAGAPDDDDDRPSDDDDDSASQDDDDDIVGLVEEPGQLRLLLAPALDVGVVLELEGVLPAPQIRVQECDTDNWFEVVPDPEVDPAFGMRLALPPIEKGTALCELELGFTETLEILGKYEKDDGEEQEFILILSPEPVRISLPESIVDDETDVSLLVRLGQPNWLSPQQIGVPPEPKREGPVVIDVNHTAYYTCLQQLQSFSSIYPDLDGDSEVSLKEEAAADDSDVGVKEAAAPRIVAFGTSICLDPEGLELDPCVGADTYEPVVYQSADQGDSWDRAEVPSLPYPTQISGAAYSEGLYLAVGSYDSTGDGDPDGGFVMTSTDTRRWGAWVVDTPIASVVRGSQDSPWVAVGVGGETFRSDNGIAWQQNGPETSGIEFREVAWSSDGLYLALGDQGQWAWSSDGESWTPSSGLGPAGSLSDARSLGFSQDGKLFVVGGGGAWSVLENVADSLSLGLAEEWSDFSVPYTPSLVSLAFFQDPEEGEMAIAVSPMMPGPFLVKQSVAQTTESQPLVVIEPGLGVRGKTIAATSDGQTLVMGGDEGVSCWHVSDFGTSLVASPHPDVTHSIGHVMVGGV